MNEDLFPKGFDLGDEQMMDDPVLEISGPNFTELGVGDGETSELSDLVGVVGELSDHSQQVVFEVFGESGG